MSAVPASRPVLVAPMTGVMVRLEDVPDPVFAQRMVGDGFSIDPLEGRLVSPVAGEVASVQPSRHALTVRSDDGLEVLMHIGLDTVQLGGDGFTTRVSAGERVEVGQLLIEFDLDEVGRRAKSLLTQVVVSNVEAISSITPVTGIVTAGESTAAEVDLAEPAADGAQPVTGAQASSDAVLVPNPTGLHARPTATLVALAKKYRSDIRLRRGDDSANAKSIVAIMGLAVACGQKVVVTAHGPDAAEAVEELAQAIQEGLGEDCPTLPSGGIIGSDDTTAMPAITEPVVDVGPRSGDWNLLLGASASPGLGIGQVVQWRHEDIRVEEQAEDRHKERRRLNTAIDRALLDLSALERRLADEASTERAEIFAAHQEILQDPELLDLAASGIDKGKSAAFAWRAAFTTLADQLAGLSNEVLAGRANDVRDVGSRVLEELTGQRSQRPELPENTILIAEDLTPSDTAQLDRSRVVGFATTGGGASSHVAIIARSLDIPAVAGIEGRALEIADGVPVVLDGSKGTLRTGVSDDEMARLRERQARMAERRAVEEAAKDDPAITTDGHRVAVVANIGGVDDAVAAMGKGAEGVGLLRSEFVFMGRGTAPSEEEQAQVYGECGRALRPGQPLVIRTLDVGGDKPLAYLPLPAEENPFLGVRGVRVGLEQPALLRAQIRAILAAAGSGPKLHVMFPMIATLEDWRRAKGIFDEERADMSLSGEVSLGIMMEVPSVAVMAEQFAAEEGCDFFSVGTNDLTSYTLAMDRGHPKLASQVDPCNPAVLTLIGRAAEALHARGKWLGVCGGVASDPQAVPILVGLGVDELSCSIPAIPAVKAAVRSWDLATCRDLARRAIACGTAAEVRALVPVDEY